MKRRVVVTGMGALTPVGNSVPESWAAVRQGRCGIAPITHYDTSRQKVKLAGEVKGWDPETVIDKKEVRRMDRFAQLALGAAVEAMAMSGLEMEREDSSRCGVLVSSGVGGFGTMSRSTPRGRKRASTGFPPSLSPWSSAIWRRDTSLSASAFGVCAAVPSPPVHRAATPSGTLSARSGTVTRR